jgi:hypothetical protein
LWLPSEPQRVDDRHVDQRLRLKAQIRATKRWCVPISVIAVEPASPTGGNALIPWSLTCPLRLCPVPRAPFPNLRLSVLRLEPEAPTARRRQTHRVQVVRPNEGPPPKVWMRWRWAPRRTRQLTKDPKAQGRRLSQTRRGGLCSGLTDRCG